MVRLKRSKRPLVDIEYLRIAAVLPLLFVDYLFAVAFSHARGNLALRLILIAVFLLVNAIGIRHFWRRIPVR